MKEPKRQWDEDPEKRKCSCGRKISMGAKSCRKCFESGKVPRRKRGRSFESVLKEVRALNLKTGESVTISGLKFTKTVGALTFTNG